MTNLIVRWPEGLPIRLTLGPPFCVATFILAAAASAGGLNAGKGDAKPPQTKEAALDLIIRAYRAADAKGLAQVGSVPVKEFPWVAEDPADKERMANMKKFGEFLVKQRPVWFEAERTGHQVAQFGPVTKAWHLHFAKKGNLWYLAAIVGGD